MSANFPGSRGWIDRRAVHSGTQVRCVRQSRLPVHACASNRFDDLLKCCKMPSL